MGSLFLSSCLSLVVLFSGSTKTDLSLNKCAEVRPVGKKLANPNVEADAILGVWLSENGDGKILISKIGGKYVGRLAWIRRKNSDGSAVLDVKNPEPARQKEKVMGLEILKGFKYEGGKTWGDGTIYDPLSGKTYSCRITTLSVDKIKIRGYVGIPLFGRSTIWSRSKLN